MKDVAVVTAHNPRNAGMLSVDLAAEHFFGESGTTWDMFKSHNAAPEGADSFAGQKIKILADVEQLKDYRVIVYWGDFINSPVY